MKKLFALVLALLLGLNVAAAEAAEFDGTWIAVLVETGGLSIPVADMGLSMVIVISGSSVSIVEGMGTEAYTLQGKGSAAAGVMAVTIPGQEQPLTLALHQDGSLVYTDEAGGMIIYFEKAE